MADTLADTHWPTRTLYADCTITASARRSCRHTVPELIPDAASSLRRFEVRHLRLLVQHPVSLRRHCTTHRAAVYRLYLCHTRPLSEHCACPPETSHCLSSLELCRHDLLQAARARDNRPSRRTRVRALHAYNDGRTKLLLFQQATRPHDGMTLRGMNHDGAATSRGGRMRALSDDVVALQRRRCSPPPRVLVRLAFVGPHKLRAPGLCRGERPCSRQSGQTISHVLCTHVETLSRSGSRLQWHLPSSTLKKQQ